MIHVSEQAKSNNRKIQYDSLKVPLEIWLEGRLRQTTICPQIYVWIDEKEQSTERQKRRKSTRRVHSQWYRSRNGEKSDYRKIQYTSSTVLLELWPEGRLRQTKIVQQIYVYIDGKKRITDVKITGNWPGEYTLDDTGVGTGGNPTAGRFYTPHQRSHLKHGWQVSSDSQKPERRYMYGSMIRSVAPT